MPADHNPFTPSFGSPPPLLAGRDEAIAAVGHALDEGPGSPRRATLVTGTRGMGKTVMLRAIEAEARTRGWLVIAETTGAGLVERISTDQLPRYLAEHDPKAVERRVTGVDLPFRAGGLTSTAEDRHQPQPTLRSQLERLTDVLAEHETGVLFTIDEVHRAHTDELRHLAQTFQHAIGDRRDVALVAAGLPSSVAGLINDDVLTFLRRAEREDLGPVHHDDVAAALSVPIEAGARHIEPAALDTAVRGTQGYPFLIQLVGYHTWNADRGAQTITTDHAEAGVAAARRRAGQLVHEPALADLSPIDRTYLAAMALDSGPSRTRDIADRMGTAPNYADVYRRRLIAAELVTPAGHGRVDFTVPGMRDYLREHAAADALNTATDTEPVRSAYPGPPQRFLEQAQPEAEDGTRPREHEQHRRGRDSGYEP